MLLRDWFCCFVFTTGKIVHLEGQARFTEKFMGYVHVKTKTKIFFSSFKIFGIKFPLYQKRTPSNSDVDIWIWSCMKNQKMLSLHSEVCTKYFLPNIKLISRENMGDIEGEQGEGDYTLSHQWKIESFLRHQTVDFLPTRSPPPGAPTSVAPWLVIGHALNGKAIIDLGHRQREGQNSSALHNQPRSPKQKRQAQK